MAEMSFLPLPGSGVILGRSTLASGIGTIRNMCFELVEALGEVEESMSIQLGLLIRVVIDDALEVEGASLDEFDKVREGPQFCG